MEKNTEINGLKINYKIAGEGPAILVLHGWGGSSDSWRKVQQILSQSGYKVVVPDFPGFGKSVTPKDPWGVKEYNDFVLKFVEQLGLNDFILIGHSFGGQIAVRFTISHPEKVKKLILCDSAAIRAKPGLRTRIFITLARLGNAVFTPRHMARFKDAARNIFYIFVRNGDYKKANGTMKETMKNVLKEDLSAELSGILAPTLIVWGDKDKMVPLKYGRIFKDQIKGAELEVIRGAGHSPHLETPVELAGIILKFLS